MSGPPSALSNPEGKMNPAFIGDSEVVVFGGSIPEDDEAMKPAVAVRLRRTSGISVLSVPPTPSKWKFSSFTPRQWKYVLIFGVTNIFRAVFILIVGPFYPPEAKDRGLNDTQIGFVISAYDFSTFAVVLIFGKFIIPKFGPRLVFRLSCLNLAICSVLFGCLDLFGENDATLFLVFSFLIRILAGAGDAGFYPSAFTILAKEFDGNISTAIGIFELLFGIGTIGGPLIFGSFIDHVGFLVVYAIVGLLIFLALGLNLLLLPPEEDKDNKDPVCIDIKKDVAAASTSMEAEKIVKPWYHLFLIPSLVLALANLFTTAASIGFIPGTLDSHLEQYQLTTFQGAVVFTVSNGVYMVSSPFWGVIADRLADRRRILIIFVGTGLIFIGFSFLGPLPFLSNQSYFWTTIVGLTFHGMGIGGAVMSAFPFASDAAIESGFPNTLETHSFISSLYILTFTLGNAVGPAVAGVLLDTVGFQNATLFIFGLAVFILISALALTIFRRKSK